MKMISTKFETISDSYSLWLALRSRAGLSISADKKSGGYDDTVASEIKEYLFPDTNGDLESLLKSHSLEVSTTQLLRAFFSALQPFSMMHYDILEMLIAASAPVGQETLQIKFDFTGDDPLIMFLSEFKKQIHDFKEVISDAITTEFGANRFWKVKYDLSAIPGDYWGEKIAETEPKRLHDWIQNRRDWDGDPIIEEFPYDACHTGVPEIDQRVEQLVSLIKFVIDASRHRASTHKGLQKYGYEAKEREKTTLLEDGIPSFELWHLESDYWSAAMAKVVAGIVHKTNQSAFDIKEFIERFDEIELPQTEKSSHRALMERIDNILDLPVWKQRHEVYSVWVGAKIWDTLKEWKILFHTVDSTLSFAFSGSHLATVISPDERVVLEWWTEKRTPAKKIKLRSKKRKNAIQPDYSILKAPISSDDPILAVVEAKQYKKYSLKNFSDALNDYASVCSKANVLLANYGSIGPSVMKNVDSRLISRTASFGNMKPNCPIQIDLFSQHLRNVLQFDKLHVNRSKVDMSDSQVILTWGEVPKDLDLHLVHRDVERGQTGHVFYDNKNIGQQITLLKDVQNGFGPEIANVKLSSGILEIFVHRYSNTGELKDSKAEVKIIDSSKLDVSYRFECPVSGAGKYWHVCNIHIESQEIFEIGEIIPNIPIVN